MLTGGNRFPMGGTHILGKVFPGGTLFLGNMFRGEHIYWYTGSEI